MTAQTDSSSELTKTPRNASGPRTVPPASPEERRDLELVAAVARGESEALRTLAERMAPRVERVSRALMGGSLDARDAALHALIELLRSHANYRGKLRLERWGDRVAAISVMRFARAVSRRDSDTGELPTPEPASDRAARTFEQYLGMLGETSRQLLLLRHALGFGIAELADVMQCSLQGARERLLASRREFRALVRRRESSPPSLAASVSLGVGAQRWCALRDREALGEPLVPEEQQEVALLEAKEPEVWAFVAQVRALELYFDTRTKVGAPIDGTLVERAVEALAVSSPTLKTNAIVVDATHETRSEREPSNWVGVFAWSISALLAAASALALYWQQPAPALGPAGMEATPIAREPKPALPVAPSPAPKPTVESLPSARTATRGARLRQGGHVLNEGTLLSQGDTVETLEKAGCLEIGPAFEACLAPGSALTVSTLQAGARRLTLGRGRVVARGNEGVGGERLSIVAEGVTVAIARGAVAVERVGEQSRARALRGQASFESGQDKRSFDEGEAAQLRDGAIEVGSAPTPLLQRDWDVLAAGLHQTVAARPPRPRAMPKLEDEPPAQSADDPPADDPPADSLADDQAE
ncbi:MAG: hypothetical protein ABW352_22115 [Polyangiales bacterium]